MREPTFHTPYFTAAFLSPLIFFGFHHIFFHSYFFPFVNWDWGKKIREGSSFDIRYFIIDFLIPFIFFIFIIIFSLFIIYSLLSLTETEGRKTFFFYSLFDYSIFYLFFFIFIIFHSIFIYSFRSFIETEVKKTEEVLFYIVFHSGFPIYSYFHFS